MDFTTTNICRANLYRKGFELRTRVCVRENESFCSLCHTNTEFLSLIYQDLVLTEELLRSSRVLKTFN